jgi:PAS domain S-box-containing protein
MESKIYDDITETFGHAPPVRFTRTAASEALPTPAREGVTNEAEFRAFFEMAGVGNAVVDVATQRFVRVNRRFEDITGYSAPELYQLTFGDITHPEDHSADDVRFRELVSGRQSSCDQEKRYLRKDGSVVWVHLSTTVICDAGGHARFQVGVITDITAQHQAQAELTAMHRRLHELVDERTAALADKTAQLENFVYTVGHDLRAPLRAINGYAEFISEDDSVRLTPDSAGYLDRVKRAARRLDSLIRDLLSYTRAADVSLQIDDVPLEPVVELAIASLRDEIERRGAEMRVETPLPSVRGEQMSLEQVVTHLVANALKFVAAGVRPHVTIRAEKSDNTVRLSITDNGIGIAPEFHDRVFRMFERLENARGYPGTGIGLPIVSKTIERLGGRVGLDSAVGRGSTFWFELPSVP